MAVMLSGCRNEIVSSEAEVPNQPVELLQQPYQTSYALSASQKYIYDSEAVPEVMLEISKDEWN